MERSCAHCAYGVKLDDDSVLCTKKGVRSILGSCRRFKYDPVKRIPKTAKAPDFKKYEEVDYSL